jgi:hypothetical protein
LTPHREAAQSLIVDRHDPLGPRVFGEEEGVEAIEGADLKQR